MESYAGIDLHSSNNYTAVIDGRDKRIYGNRLSNKINTVISALEPFKETLKGVVESTRALIPMGAWCGSGCAAREKPMR